VKSAAAILAAVFVGAQASDRALGDSSGTAGASPTPALTPLPAQSGLSPSSQPTMGSMPPTYAPQTPSFNQTPAPDPDQYPSLVRSGPTPAPSPSGSPGTPAPQMTSPPPTPPPGFGRITADRLYGKANGDMDADGHVLIISGDSSISADRAHFDSAAHVVRATGNVHYVAANGDTAVAQALEYDVARDRVVMDHVEGQSSSVTYQAERIRGYLYYKGDRITIEHNGHAVLERGWVTTCDLLHVAYHITGKEIEIRPNDRLIARGPALYLGRLLVAGLGILVVPLTPEGQRRQTAVAPRIGYNSIYGVFIKNYINFYSSPYFYGTYHIDLFQKAGVGLGVDLFFARRDGNGSGELTLYNLHSNATQRIITGTTNSFQSTLTLQRLFAHHVTLSANANYTSQTLLTSIPPTLSANVSIVHAGARSTTSYGGTATTTGPNSAFGALINHNIAFSPVFSENVSLQLQVNSAVSGSGTTSEFSSFSRSVIFMDDTRYSASAFDADLVIATNHGQTSSSSSGTVTTTPVIGLQKVPELTVHSRPFSIANIRLPVTFTLTDGIYDDGYDSIVTARHELAGQLGSAIYRIGDSTTISALVGVRQDLYGTGDERGVISEAFSLQNYVGRHADNTLAYQEQSVRGFTPMPAFDLLTGSDGVNDILNVYNGSAYRFTASANYNFSDKFLSPIAYQLSVSPTPYSSVLLGDSYDPHGTGYGPLTITLSTPVGRNDYLQFLGNYDFKMHNLTGQNWFLTHTVNDCYQIRIAYRQPLHEVDVSVNLLAFPNQAVNFGLNGGSLVPQSFGSP
jgi:hypothetical protein